MKLLYTILKKSYFLLYAVFSMWKRPKGAGQRCIQLDIPDMHMQRRLYYLCAYFQKSGFFTYIVMSPRQVMGLNKYGIKAFRLPNTKLTFHRKRPTDILVFHGADDLFKTTTPRIELSVDVFTLLKEDKIGKHDLFFPIGFHPHNLDKITERQLHKLRGYEKQIGLFFAGNIDKAKYNNQKTNRLFQIMNRWEVVQALLTAPQLAPRIVQPESYAQLIELLESGALKDKIVVCDSKRAPVPKDEWFNIIAQSRYFFAPPGVIQPYCHNLVEAMSVGTVPVSQLARFYRPLLQDNHTAVCFDGPEQLIEKVKHILEHPDRVPEKEMRGTVVDYYERHFSPRAFQQKMESYIRHNYTDGKLIFSHNKESVRLFEMYMDADPHE